MLSDERSIVIARLVEEVFAFVGDVRNNPLWNGWIVESELVSGDGGAGSTSRHVARFLGKRIEAEAVITAYEPNQRACTRTTAGPIPTHGCRMVERVDGGTRFTQTIEAQPGGFFGLAEHIVVRLAARQLESDMLMLKELLKSGAGPQVARVAVPAAM